MLPTFFKAATTASVVLAALSATVYVVVHYFLGLQHVTCFGGTFGLFGDVSMASKPFIEYQVQRDVAYLFGMTRKLYEMETNFQHIEVYAHRYFGHVLVIDGSLQITERDEVNYHEMTAHIPMAYFPDAKKVLVIGGGDGGALLQLLMHPNVETAHLVDIDMFAMRDMVAAYFPYLHSAYLDPRTRAFAYDGRRWVDEQLEVPENHHSYEVVVLDSTDYGAAESLFTEEFYKQLKNLMATTSILVANVDSPSWNLETVIAVQLLLSKLFKHVYIFHSNQPTFLSGHYSYVFCSDEIHPMKSPIDWNRWAEKKITTYYYNEDVHYASFVLPEFIRSSLLVGSRLKDLPLGEKHPFATREFKQEPPADALRYAAAASAEETDESLAREDDD